MSKRFISSSVTLILCGLLGGCDYIEKLEDNQVDRYCDNQDDNAYYCASLTATQLESCNAGPDGVTLYSLTGTVIDPEQDPDDSSNPIPDLSIGVLIYGAPFQANQPVDWDDLDSPYADAIDRDQLDNWAANANERFALYWTSAREDDGGFSLSRVSVPTSRLGLRDGLNSWTMYGEVILADDSGALQTTGKGHPITCSFDANLFR